MPAATSGRRSAAPSHARRRGRRPAFKRAAGGWGAVTVDLDHDGRLDIVTTSGWEIANGAGFPEWENERNCLFHHSGDLAFSEVAAAWGLHHTGQGRGLVHFDYDNDGHQDLAIFTKDERIRLFHNDLAAPDRHWLRVLLDTRARPALAPDDIGDGSEVS